MRDNVYAALLIIFASLAVACVIGLVILSIKESVTVRCVATLEAQIDSIAQTLWVLDGKLEAVRAQAETALYEARR